MVRDNIGDLLPAVDSRQARARQVGDRPGRRPAAVDDIGDGGAIERATANKQPRVVCELVLDRVDLIRVPDEVLWVRLPPAAHLGKQRIGASWQNRYRGKKLAFV